MATTSYRLAAVAGPESIDMDDGWPLLHDGLADVGIDSVATVWKDSQVDWQSFDAVIVSYVWGYISERREFLAWARRVSRQTRIVNPEPVLAWNSDKTYLADLASDRIPTVSTQWVPPGATWQPPADDYVIKPTVASGGIGAARYIDSEVEIAQRHVRRLHAEGQTVMVQPYQGSVDAEGETALIFFDGSYSHAVWKQAILQPDVGEIYGLWERQRVARATPRVDQQRLAEVTLAAVDRRLGPLSYARVDMVDGTEGRPVVLEVELVEPAFFLTHDLDAAGRLAAALRRLLDERALD